MSAAVTPFLAIEPQNEEFTGSVRRGVDRIGVVSEMKADKQFIPCEGRSDRTSKRIIASAGAGDCEPLGRQTVSFPRTGSKRFAPEW